MTWNELIDLLQTIPEDRREETAIFGDRDNLTWQIDSMEEVSVFPDSQHEDDYFGPFDSNAGNDETTYVLAP